MSTQKRITKPHKQSVFTTEQKNIIHGVYLQAVDEKKIVVHPDASPKDNYRSLLDALRRESKIMAIRLPKYPSSQSSEYKYLKRFLELRLKEHLSKGAQQPIDDSVMSEEEASVTMGGPSPSTRMSSNSPSKSVTPSKFDGSIPRSQHDKVESQQIVLNKRDKKILFNDAESSLDEQLDVEDSRLSLTANDSPPIGSSLVEDHPPLNLSKISSHPVQE